MSEQTSFGRRRAPTARELLTAPALSPEAEAFRAQLSAGRKPPETDFATWKGAQRARRYFAWFAAFALLCPGVLCFIFHAPGYVSAGLEITGIGANFWLRRERRRHLSEIASWEPQP